jgi:CheY-like chemotaxis protein
MATIIVQESDEAVLDVITLTLEEEGHNVIGFLGQCPIGILQKLKQHLPDIVLIDYWGMCETGRLILDTIKSFSPRIPVIALSCDANISDLAKTVGFTGYIKKPFELVEIHNVLRPLL